MNTVLTIDRTIPFDPAAFVGEAYSLVNEDERSLNLIEIDVMNIIFVTVLEPNDAMLAKCYVPRLKESGHIRLDANIFKSLWEDWKNNKMESLLEQLRIVRGVTKVVFPGSLLRYEINSQYHYEMLGFYWYDNVWNWELQGLVQDPSAVLAS